MRKKILIVSFSEMLTDVGCTLTVILLIFKKIIWASTRISEKGKGIGYHFYMINIQGNLIYLKALFHTRETVKLYAVGVL